MRFSLENEKRILWVFISGRKWLAECECLKFLNWLKFQEAKVLMIVPDSEKKEIWQKHTFYSIQDFRDTYPLPA